MRTTYTVRPDVDSLANLVKIKHWCRKNNLSMNRLLNLMIADLATQLSFWQEGDAGITLDIKLPKRPKKINLREELRKLDGEENRKGNGNGVDSSREDS
jgi:hypothetical protein